jgi:hypothetical protein
MVRIVHELTGHDMNETGHESKTRVHEASCQEHCDYSCMHKAIQLDKKIYILDWMDCRWRGERDSICRQEYHEFARF